MLFVNALWGIMVGDWVASSIKSKTLMVPDIRKQFGLSPALTTKTGKGSNSGTIATASVLVIALSVAAALYLRQ